MFIGLWRVYININEGIDIYNAFWEALTTYYYYLCYENVSRWNQCELTKCVVDFTLSGNPLLIHKIYDNELPLIVNGI